VVKQPSEAALKVARTLVGVQDISEGQRERYVVTVGDPDEAHHKVSDTYRDEHSANVVCLNLLCKIGFALDRMMAATAIAERRRIGRWADARHLAATAYLESTEYGEDEAERVSFHKGEIAALEALLRFLNPESEGA
jgi:hypothetical protein